MADAPSRLGSLRERLTLRQLLRSRWFVLGGMGAAHGVLTATGVGGIPCPLRTTTGIPCPLCGLSRGVVALSRGRFREAIEYHAFAPVVVVALLMSFVAALLRALGRPVRVPASIRNPRFHTWAFGVLAVTLASYWLFRLVFVGDSYLDRIRG